MANTTNTYQMDMKQSNFFEILMKPMQDLLTKAYETIFNSMQNTFYNNLSYTIIVVIILYWLIMRLKIGYPTRDEIFEAGKWLFMVLFVYAIFSSFEAYVGFCNLIMIPANWVRSGVSSLIDMKGETLPKIVLEALNMQNVLANDLFKEGIKQLGEKKSWYEFWKSDDFKGVVVAFYLFWYWLYYIAFMFCIIACLCIVLGAQFITMLLLSVAPILIPFLIIKPLKAYFYSWLKLVISYSLYPSIALILLVLVMQPINDLKTAQNTANIIKDMYENTFFTFVPVTGFCFFVIYLMTKIPNWVSQIMGVSGLDSGGVGAGLAIAKNAGLATASGGVGAVAGGIKGAMSGQSLGGALGKGFLGAIGGGLKQSAKTLPGAKSVRGAVTGMRNAISEGRKVSNGAGATASA